MDGNSDNNKLVFYDRFSLSKFQGGLEKIMRIQNRFEAEVKSIKAKMDSISGVYDDLNEKMHDVDKTM